MRYYILMKELYELTAITGFTIAGLRWFSEQIRFIYVMKNNHLKHINHYLKLICIKLDIPYDEEFIQGK